MIQEKLRQVRMEKGLSQEKIAKILSTDTSNYSRKERGKIKIRDDEWEKMAKALGVSVQELKSEIAAELIHNNSVFNDNSGNQNIFNAVIENLQDYIHFLKEENQSLKKEIEEFKNK
ncbi:helix-turn-helix domain-containing protein [Chryseobacterium ginsenosidimutans]|uniref:helix-turn-helix domain-containing protein n=1 Tax=Chryseobacterium ginsenosidimutans TaxID=687846 RepID=UPI00216A6F97|nr:helix-turn-helix transcriptional regulator [Chryseobacterium ginsenosidimutans]